jgi:porphobilinogen deaminase
LFFEGIRNTKAVFNATFNGTSLADPVSTTPTPTTPAITAAVYPNPVRGTLNVKLSQINNGNYTAIVYNNEGKRMLTSTQSLTIISNVMTLNMRPFASGEYHLVVKDASGNEIVNEKIIKISN